MENEILLTELKAALINLTAIYGNEIKKVVFKDGYEEEEEGSGLITELRRIRKIQQKIYRANLKLTLRPLTDEEIKEKEEHGTIWEKIEEVAKEEEQQLKTLLSKLPDYSIQREVVKDIIIYACNLINHDSTEGGGFYFLTNAPRIFYWICCQFGFKSSVEEIKTAFEFVHKFYLSGVREIKAEPELFLNTYHFVGDAYMKESYDFFKLPYSERKKREETPYLKMEKIILDQVKND